MDRRDDLDREVTDLVGLIGLEFHHLILWHIATSGNIHRGRRTIDRRMTLVCNVWHIHDVVMMGMRDKDGL